MKVLSISNNRIFGSLTNCKTPDGELSNIGFTMKNFEKRRDRFEFFDGFEKPLLNITFRLRVPDFRKFCSGNKLPPFHFFLYQVTKSLVGIENFRYRIHEGEIISIDRFFPSYTTLSAENLFNYTNLEYTPDMKEFIQRSLNARNEVLHRTELCNAGFGLSVRELKDHFFITSIPWLDFTAIEHPIFRFKSSDIPAIAWGKFNECKDGIEMPFAVQAHHGFVDAYHIHLLSEMIQKNILEAIDPGR